MSVAVDIIRRNSSSQTHSDFSISKTELKEREREVPKRRPNNAKVYGAAIGQERADADGRTKTVRSFLAHILAYFSPACRPRGTPQSFGTNLVWALRAAACWPQSASSTEPAWRLSALCLSLFPFSHVPRTVIAECTAERT